MRCLEVKSNVGSHRELYVLGLYTYSTHRAQGQITQILNLNKTISSIKWPLQLSVTIAPKNQMRYLNLGRGQSGTDHPENQCRTEKRVDFEEESKRNKTGGNKRSQFHFPPYFYSSNFSSA